MRVSMRLQKATSGADVSSAHAKAVVGAGSDQAATRRRACWNPRTNSCHMCAQGNPQEPVGQATCRTMESLDELWQGLPEYCAPSRGTPLGPETAPVDAAKTRWFDDAPENIRRIAIATRAREEYEE